MLAWLAVVFGGIVGNGAPEADRISTEIVAAVRERAELTPIKVPAKQLATLTHHGSGSRDVVARLHVDGLIGGELIDHNGTLTLRLVVYAADGGLRSLSEITLRNRALGFDDFAVIRSNLSDEVLALAAKVAPAPTPVAKPVSKPAPVAPPPPVVVKAAPVPPPAAKPTPIAKPAPAIAKAAPATEAEPEIEMDPTPASEAVAAVDAEPSPIEESPTAVAASVETDDEDPVLGLRVAVGLGVSARNFAPGPSTVAGYSASPVGTITFAARIQPAKKLCLDALVDRTLSMSTPMGAEMASTSMSRWEVSGDYLLREGRLAVASRIGLGRRAFAIDSSLGARTPDSDYNYLILGATASAALGHGFVAHALAAFEPVLWGKEPTEMAFGEARRWAVDVGAALELRPSAHLFARVSADLQRFAWTWTSAGARGSGGAVDLFPSAMASLGATY